MNIISTRILSNYQANRTDIQKRLDGLSTSSYQYQVLFEKDKQAIKNANTRSRTISTADEFQAYMKYCMFNLEKCGFQAFGEIKQGFWPVSELNVLFREGIITLTDTSNIYANISGREALTILYHVFRNFSKCNFNLDYDCDGVPNHIDNCPYDYNPNQFDFSGNGKGNVCNDDIDGDGLKNPLGIVDDNNNIVIDKRDNTMDPTPLGDGRMGF